MVMVNWVIAVSGTVVGFGMLWAYRKILPPQIPLWYSRPWGEEQLAKPSSLAIVPIGIILAALTVEVIRRWVRDEVLVKICLVCAITAEVILTLGMLRIIMLIV